MIQFYHTIAETVSGFDAILNPFELYTLPLDDWIGIAVDFFVDHFRPLFQAIRSPVELILNFIESRFLSIPPLILILALGLITWQIGGRAIAIYTILTLTLIGLLGIWKATMVTLSLVLTAIILCVVVGIPVGILAAKNDRIDRWIRPLLDTMQTLPAFVYLVPVVMLFGIGRVPGTIATFIFAVPPLIRLTNLGIRQVSPEAVEAAIAFGSTPLQILWNVQLPLSLPAILTGINQAIVLALSMSVIASMIAVEGLGQLVLQGVGRQDVGLAAVGGFGIVSIAILLDRIAIVIANSGGSWRDRGIIKVLSRNRKNSEEPLEYLS